MAQIGKYTYFADNVTHTIGGGVEIIIGKFCSIAANVTFLGKIDHHVDWISLYAFAGKTVEWPEARGLEWPTNAGDIVIGNDVWIGHGASIFSGVHIGDGAAIGAFSVVAKDIPPYAIAVGNPCSVKRFRFKQEDIDYLLKLKWWDKPEEWIHKNLPLLCSPDIERLKSL